MMKVPSIKTLALRAASLAIVCFGAALSGCVSYGDNTHALLTPIGVVGYHTFKPQGTERIRPPELKTPDRVAATPPQQQPPEDPQNET